MGSTAVMVVPERDDDDDDVYRTEWCSQLEIDIRIWNGSISPSGPIYVIVMNDEIPHMHELDILVEYLRYS